LGVSLSPLDEPLREIPLVLNRPGFRSKGFDKGDKLTPKNVDELHTLLSEVMVRNRRSTVGLQFTQRFARTESVAMTGAEKALYDAVAALVRDQLRAETKTTALNRMTLITLQMALGSSSAAAAAMLRKPVG